jgi:hypothetical protein
MSIQKSAKRHYEENARASNSPDRDVYHESKSKTLPPIGSRVRKGPDWHPRQKDSNGPGTVIGHADNGTSNISVQHCSKGTENNYFRGLIFDLM